MKAAILQLIAERIGRNYSYGNEPVTAALNELREAVEALRDPAEVDYERNRMPDLREWMQARINSNPIFGPGLSGDEPVTLRNLRCGVPAHFLPDDLRALGEG